MIGSVVIGPESSVWPGAVLRGDDGEIRIGARTSVQDNSVLHTTPDDPTVVGDECVIGHIVHLEGCIVHDRAMVGNGAIVLHRSVVGTGAIVAANSVVLYDVDVPPGALAVGAPATIKPGRARIDDILRGVETYVARAKRFRRRAPKARLMLALVLTVPANEVELASDALWGLGVAAVEERWPSGDDDGTEDRFVELWTSLGTDLAAVDRSGGGVPGALALAHRRARSRRGRQLAGPRRTVVGRPRPGDRAGVARPRRCRRTCSASTSTPAPRSVSATTRRPS